MYKVTIIAAIIRLMLNPCPFILPASAAGIEASPAKFELSINSEKPLTEQITIANPTADVQVFEIYADDFPDIFKFNLASFTLESGARKTVQMTIIPQGAKLSDSQTMATTISILGTPLAETRFQASTGVKIPIRVTLANLPGKKTPYLQIGLVLLAFVMVALVSARRGLRGLQ